MKREKIGKKKTLLHSGSFTIGKKAQNVVNRENIKLDDLPTSVF